MHIKLANGLIDKVEYSNYVDYNTYPNSSLTCEKCRFNLGFNFSDLDKHRFSKFSNLKYRDKVAFERLILSMIPRYKLNQKRQISAITKRDILILMVQRLYLRFIGIKGEFLPLPKRNENIPDSFIDYHCPNCQTPVRIYYDSFIGGRHTEIGFVIKYVIS